MAAARRSATCAAALSDTASSDAQLLAAFAKGDQNAARALTIRHAPGVLALARRMLADAAEAEDVAQEAMLRAWRAAPGWRNEKGAKFSTWLHRVTLNLCYDRLRKTPHAQLENTPEPPDPTPSAQTQLEARGGAKILAQALLDLPPRQRAAVVLRHYHEASNPQIAQVLEVSVEAVESLLSRGRRSLKKLLKDRRAELLDE